MQATQMNACVVYFSIYIIYEMPYVYNMYFETDQELSLHWYYWWKTQRETVWDCIQKNWIKNKIAVLAPN